MMARVERTRTVKFEQLLNNGCGYPLNSGLIKALRVDGEMRPMIDIIVADHKERFQLGLQQVLAVASDVRIVGQSQSPEQLLNTLKQIKATSFRPMLSNIQPMLEPRQDGSIDARGRP